MQTREQTHDLATQAARHLVEKAQTPGEDVRATRLIHPLCELLLKFCAVIEMANLHESAR